MPLVTAGVVTSCTDSDVGECAKTKGSCVCSISQEPTYTDPQGRRVFCPGEQAGGQKPPKCFGAGQPKPQSCNATAPLDDDCDGRIDAPDGVNLAMKGMPCGNNVGQCKQGTIVGCDQTKSNAYVQFGLLPAADAWWVCSTDTVYPQAELCNGFDDDCNGALGNGAGSPDERDLDRDKYMACTGCPATLGSGYLGCGDCNDANVNIHPGAPELCNNIDDDCNPATADGSGECGQGANLTRPTCCSSQASCKDLTSDPLDCGMCGNVCIESGPAANANGCGGSNCVCGASPACAAGSWCNSGSCNGCNTKGHCGPSCVDCGSSVCNGTACAACNVDADCASSTPATCAGGNCYCSGGACLTKKGKGASCTAANQCATGNCVDNGGGSKTCCTAAACGGCNTCASGDCVAAAPNTNPHNVCNAGPCESDNCDGAGTCNAPNGSGCGTPSCSGSTITASMCMSGMCIVGGGMACPGNLQCASATACYPQPCTADAQCNAGYFCNASGVCVMQHNLGGMCNRPAQCSNGQCVDNTCCSTASCGTCQACNLNGAGTCSPVGPGTNDPDTLPGGRNHHLRRQRPLQEQDRRGLSGRQRRLLQRPVRRRRVLHHFLVPREHLQHRRRSRRPTRARRPAPARERRPTAPPATSARWACAIRRAASTATAFPATTAMAPCAPLVMSRRTAERAALRAARSPTPAPAEPASAAADQRAGSAPTPARVAPACVAPIPRVPAPPIPAREAASAVVVPPAGRAPRVRCALRACAASEGRRLPLLRRILLFTLAGCSAKTGMLVEVQGPAGQSSIAAGVATLELVAAHRSWCERWVEDKDASHTRVDVHARDLHKKPYTFLIEPNHVTDLSEPVEVIVLARDANDRVIGAADFGDHPYRLRHLDEYTARIALLQRPEASYAASDGCVCLPGAPWMGNGSGAGCDLDVVTSFDRLIDTAGCELPPGARELTSPVCDGQQYDGETVDREHALLRRACWGVSAHHSHLPRSRRRRLGRGVPA